ncbi:polysaccharide deacetylase family protein [Peribacillus acanthi]|uniref:polysaccharide deacetylase family protein n=1 Tax=Peribacillus acanthi TaxID=2171554 RepID=UPI000D3E41FC|nr:polysaccharide deacetylase family protein [Peribacillus acanthi]
MRNGAFSKLKIITTCMILFLFLPALTKTVSANESMLPVAPIYIDGEPIDTKYTLREGHLLVPALFLKDTGAYVDWNEEYRSVVFSMKNIKFALPVGKKFSDDYVGGTWKRSSLPTETLDFNGVPFVPLITVAKKLGMDVRYDASLARTFITTNYSVKANNIKQANTSEKLVALTFDDGPEILNTPKILDILKEKGVPATFFVMGKQIKQFPDDMKRIVNEGHAIANHTYNHNDSKVIWTDQLRKEIQSTQEEMVRVVGKKPDIFRPPYGSFSKADMRLLNELGIRNILWSVDTLDWSGTTAEDILKIVHRDISPGGIVLQHNFQSDRLIGTVEALPKIIDELKAKGYRFVTIQTLLASQTETPNPNQ